MASYIKMKLQPPMMNGDVMKSVLHMNEMERSMNEIEVYCTIEQFGLVMLSQMTNENSRPMVSGVKNVMKILGEIPPPSEIHVYNRVPFNAE